MKKHTRIRDKALLKSYWFKRCCIPGCHAGATPSHIKTRGSGGADAEYNLTALCLAHHTEWGQSWIKFCQKYPDYTVLLEQKGWELDFENAKMFHAELLR